MRKTSWTRREPGYRAVSYLWLFGSVYSLFLIWSLTQLFRQLASSPIVKGA